MASIATETPDDFALAGSGRGDAVVAWSTFDTQFMQNVVRAAVRPAGTSSFGGAEDRLEHATSYGSMPQIALDEQGDAVLAYQEGATPTGVDITVFDASAPQVSVTGPSKVLVKTGASFQRIDHRRVLAVRDEVVLRRRGIGDRLIGVAHVHP